MIEQPTAEDALRALEPLVSYTTDFDLTYIRAS